MEGTGIQDVRCADDLVVHNVGMAIADEVKFSGMDRPLEQPKIVAVKKRNFAIFDFQGSKCLVTNLSCRFHRAAEIELIVVVISEDKMRLPAIKERDNFRTADISAVNHCDRGMFFEHGQCPLCRRDFAVGVTDDNDPGHLLFITTNSERDIQEQSNSQASIQQSLEFLRPPLAGEFDQYLHGRFHLFQTSPFERGMRIVFAR